MKISILCFSLIMSMLVTIRVQIRYHECIPNPNRDNIIIHHLITGFDWMSYLDADVLERSILSKSMMTSEPVRIQEAPDLDNIPGIKIKGTTEEWANSDICSVCKQPFNANRNVNRHHWYLDRQSSRICGGSACGECSRKKINLERACDFCFLKQLLKKQEHERKEQFRQREQGIEKMNKEIRDCEVEVENLDKEIVQVERSNIELEVRVNKEAVEKKNEIEARQKQLKKQQEQTEDRKKKLMDRKSELDTREARNQEFQSKVNIIKMEISSKQASLLDKMEELERFKVELDKLETQKTELLADFK